jgi:tRNA G10  N-methylase Trm11
MPHTSYLFILGRTPELAFVELHTLFPQITRLSDEIALLDADHVLEVHRIMGTLGGTTKIAELVGRTATVSSEMLLPYIEKGARSVEFGFSFYGFSDIPKNLPSDMKDKLNEQGVRSRYVKAEHGDVLSSVVVEKAHLQELIIIKKDNGYVIGKTVAVQPYEEWNKRDYGRPHADAKSGMLPPKVARMIVNIAGNGKKTILDPFCGMGTILAEGYMVGETVLGSDASQDVIAKAKDNISWLTKTYPDTGGHIGSMTVCDAVHISEHISSHSVDAIVTEPYMGSTGIVNQKTADTTKIKNIIRGLEKLYIGCLRDWRSVLVSQGIIIIALPSYAISGREYFVKKVVDMCENLGYTIVDGPIEYSRPQAIVKRQFYIFRLVS